MDMNAMKLCRCVTRRMRLDPPAVINRPELDCVVQDSPKERDEENSEKVSISYSCHSKAISRTSIIERRDDAISSPDSGGPHSGTVAPRVVTGPRRCGPFPLQAYCQLIGLTHGIRTAIRGAPRELSFQCPLPLDDPCHWPSSEDEYCVAPCLPADALAAIVGPARASSD
ncbi:hypothetical protein PAPYR_11326 [Paratrimastix pyriformis]|uniref:Uncharacterized protein n=1 Tax=Paratrimastix pyriformis TaxID=342808 RepID=A0ABQ8U9N5_9EUKA|nr:hypothetical protein PAPYR_11326 [Paratrimastix pyriformis]